MSGVVNRKVAPGEGDQRLDRWFKKHYPDLSFGKLAKLLRTGQVRLDGHRVKPSTRVSEGQTVRVPPLGGVEEGEAAPPRRKPQGPAKAERRAAESLQKAVLYRDEWVIAIDKPAGLAVQGGSGLTRHIDELLDHLKFGASERPRLVHRLDKDTSGVLLLARTAEAARRLTAAFRGKDTEKTYWAVVVGCPRPLEGKIDAALAKRPGRGGEKVRLAGEEGQRAVTLFRTLDHAGRKAALLELQPLTGRTHQLRVHCAAIGTPILGDGKYGGPGAFIEGLRLPKQMHLHARRIRLPHPRADGSFLAVEAPLPPHMIESLKLLGLEGAEA
jgi:23S rRNA pseudouridine955/2504/2580 synthase